MFKSGRCDFEMSKYTFMGFKVLSPYIFDITNYYLIVINYKNSVK